MVSVRRSWARSPKPFYDAYFDKMLISQQYIIDENLASLHTMPLQILFVQAKYQSLFTLHEHSLRLVNAFLYKD
jgi:hypothetical protein